MVRMGPGGDWRRTTAFLAAGGRGYVGVHAAFTCTDDTLAAAADMARRHDVGVHIHVAEGPPDADAAMRLAGLTDERWLLIHGVHLQDDHGLRGTVVHNPRSNMNNAVGYADPVRFAATNPIALGTDGIGSDMLDEFRVAYARLREHDVTASPDPPWEWLAQGWELMPEPATTPCAGPIPAPTRGISPTRPGCTRSTSRSTVSRCWQAARRRVSTPPRCGPRQPSRRSGSSPHSTNSTESLD